MIRVLIAILLFASPAIATWHTENDREDFYGLNIYDSDQDSYSPIHFGLEYSRTYLSVCTAGFTRLRDSVKVVSLFNDVTASLNVRGQYLGFVGSGFELYPLSSAADFAPLLGGELGLGFAHDRDNGIQANGGGIGVKFHVGAMVKQGIEVAATYISFLSAYDGPGFYGLELKMGVPGYN